jgi:hypothetical protein
MAASVVSQRIPASLHQPAAQGNPLHLNITNKADFRETFPGAATSQNILCIISDPPKLPLLLFSPTINGPCDTALSC